MSNTLSVNDNNKTVDNQPIISGKHNDETIHQNGHAKSDVAVIDIIDDGKLFPFIFHISIDIIIMSSASAKAR